MTQITGEGFRLQAKIGGVALGLGLVVYSLGLSCYSQKDQVV